MTKLYALSQTLKAHAFYRAHRDEVHYLFFRLGLENKLTAEHVLDALMQSHPEWIDSYRSSLPALQQLEEKTKALQDQGYHFVCLGESAYPRSFYAMEEPPLAFSYIGKPLWMNRPCLSIVGSREPSFDSLQWMEKEMAAFLESQNIGVISGGARGVDQKAHSLSLRAHQPTCIVLPSGLGQLYPANLKEWVQAIVEQGGCLLSEYDHAMPMQKYLFPHRNRLIAALGLATVIIEARLRSGTLITAEQACQAGRPVWVLPGHPQDPHFSGSLQLLMEGATMIRHAEDLRALFTVEALSFDINLVGIGSYGRFGTTGSDDSRDLSLL